MKSADDVLKKKRDALEHELPRFVATVAQQLKASRDVLTILERYRKTAGDAMRSEPDITVADMQSGNLETALVRFESRMGSAMLSDVVRGLVGVIRGDNSVAFFELLAHDFKQFEIQRLKLLAMKRPGKITDGICFRPEKPRRPCDELPDLSRRQGRHLLSRHKNHRQGLPYQRQHRQTRPG